MSDRPASPTPPNDAVKLTPLQRAFLALEQSRAQVAELQTRGREPIAVIGVGCRAPGGGDGPEAFWRLMRDGVDATGPVPAERWDADALYDADPDAPGRIVTRNGGFLRDVDQFDPEFFNIAPREALGMDPQQRLMLEVAWEALEHAGQAPDRLERTPTGVYVGLCGNDYAQLQFKTGDTALLDSHFTSGMAHSIASGRLSYLLGLQGPAITIDTACSSSLVAIHLACQALRDRDCDMALAGGVNLILAPELFIALSHSRMLAPDGRCKTFDAAADGFARAEACGAVVLKRLSDAERDGDRILAVIRGSAVNQDGPSSGLTAPNGPQQEAVIREALERGGVAPREVGYIEAHGTGTQLGDPLEVQALGAVFGSDREPGRPLLLGSVKTNIGHTEAAAGVMGFIKIVLALRNREIPPHLHFKTPSPHIAWGDLPLRVATERTPWVPLAGKRIAGVSSFGFSGTNAHVVLEEAPVREITAAAREPRACLLAISARDERALAALAKRYAAALAERPDADLPDICFTANTGRAHMAQRATIVAHTMDELRSRLRSLADGVPADGVHTGRLARRDPPRVAFLFTGQGAQYAGMARGLYDAAPIFRTALDRCAAVLAPLLDRPLLDLLFSTTNPAALLDETGYTQPALFAVEYALTELWRSWGIMPNAVIGHSVGEYVAACVAGVLGLEDGLRLIAERGRLMHTLPAGGAMTAIFAPEEQVAAALAAYGATVSMAAVNGPRQTVISGVATDVDAIARAFTAQGVRCKSLPVSHAFHSPLMEPMLAAFEREADAVHFSAPRIRLISNVTGKPAEAAEMARPSYWSRHVREAVRFGDGIRALAALRPDCAIEIGPQSALLTLTSEALGADAPVLVPSLRRNSPDWEQMLDGLATLYLEGANVNWREVGDRHANHIVDLPSYPFQRERFWFRARPRAAVRGAADRGADHPLLGRRLRSPLPQAQFESRLTADDPAFIRDHVVTGTVVLPGTASLEMALAAARTLFGPGAHAVEDLVLREAMMFDDAGARIVQTIVEPVQGGAAEFRIQSTAEGGEGDWTLHFQGRLRIARGAAPAAESIATLEARMSAPTDAEPIRTRLRAQGLDFGPRFRSVRTVRTGEREALGDVELPPEAADEVRAYGIHPALLDGCVQVVGAALPRATDEADGGALYLPVGVGRFRLFGAVGAKCRCHATVDRGARQGVGAYRATARVYDADGTLVAEVESLEVQRVSADALEKLAARRATEWLFERRWTEQPVEADPGTRSAFVVLADRGGIGEALASALRGRGDRCVVQSVHEAADDRVLCRRWRDELTSAFGIIDLRWLDTADWDGAGGCDVEGALERPVSASLALVQAALEVCPDAPPRMWLITRGAQNVGSAGTPLAPYQAAAWGLAWSVAIEHPELRQACIDLDSAVDADEVAALAREVRQSGREDQVSFRNGRRWVARLARWDSTAGAAARALPPGESWRLVAAEKGTLDRLELVAERRRAPAAGEVEIRVGATGLNFRDVLNALGLYPGDPGPLGGECAGTITRTGEGVDGLSVGDAVVAMASGCFAGHVIARKELVQCAPAGFTTIEAAAFPIAYITASYTLEHVARLRAGEYVLIHAAAGGVGMAAVNLALRAGAEVIATAGSDAKRARLRSLGVRHVLDSRNVAFANEVLALTGGRGADVVLNSLSGDFIDASFRAAANGARFIEIGKRGIWTADQVRVLGKAIAYHVVDVGTTAEANPALIEGIFARLCDDLAAGRLPALPVTVFPVGMAADAFRHMMQARQIGKIVVTHENAPRAPIARPEGTYLVTGGMSGLGLRAAEWLAGHGARHLALVGRRGMTAEAEPVVRALRGAGVSVATFATDIADERAMQGVLARVRETAPPIRGILHAAGTTDDGAISAQSWARFAKLLHPKVTGLRVLGQLTRTDPIDWLVIYSSAASILGSAGQANYAAANAVLDAVAHERRRVGRPAQSVNWGLWRDTGLAGSAALQERIVAQGLTPMSTADGLLALGKVMQLDTAQVGVVIADWDRLVARRVASGARGGVPAYFANVSGTFRSDHSDAKVAAQSGPPLSELLAAAAPGRRAGIVRGFVRERALHVLGQKDSRTLDDRTPLGELGLDSLLAVELRNALGRALGTTLPATLLFDHPTVETLAEFLRTEVLGGASTTEQIEAATESAPTGSAVLAGIADLSDEEVERLLAARQERKP